MEERPLVEVGHRGEADVRVREDVEAAPGLEPHGAHVVEVDERPDHAARPPREEAADGEAADVARARVDQTDLWVPSQ